MEGKMEVGAATYNMNLMAAATTFHRINNVQSSTAQVTFDDHKKPTTEIATALSFEFDLSAHIRSAKMAIRNSFEAQGLTNVVQGADEYLKEVLHRMGEVVMQSQVTLSNISASDSVRETTEIATTQILQQAPTAVQAQANVSKKNVLSLLQN